MKLFAHSASELQRARKFLRDTAGALGLVNWMSDHEIETTLARVPPSHLAKMQKPKATPAGVVKDGGSFGQKMAKRFKLAPEDFVFERGRGWFYLGQFLGCNRFEIYEQPFWTTGQVPGRKGKFSPPGANQTEGWTKVIRGS